MVTEQAGAAQVYALAGLRIFPVWNPTRQPDGTWQCACPRGPACTSPAKHPMIPPAHPASDPARGKCRGECGRIGHGLYDATADLSTVGAWWQYRPHANIGLPAQGNGYAILDIDPRHNGHQSFTRLAGAAKADAQVDLADTLTQHTGSGGTHLLYAKPAGGVRNSVNSFGADMPGIDIRGIGGYVVAWPSVHLSGQQYEWDDFLRDPAPWPAILSEYLKPAPAPAPAPAPTKGRARGYAAAALEKETADLQATGEGGRNHRLNRAAFSLGQLVAAGELAEADVIAELTAAARGIGLNEHEITASIRSGFRGAAAKPRAPR